MSHFEIDIPVTDCYATASFERQSFGYLVGDVEVWLSLFGRSVRVELTPEVERQVRDLIGRHYEQHDELRGADDWKKAQDL